MILEKFKLTTDEESGDFLILSGRSLESIFERRVVNKQTNLDGELGAGISHLLEKNCIYPDRSDSDKTIPQLRVNNLSGFTEHLEKQITGDTLLSVFTDICVSKDCGFKLTCDDTPNKFTFTLYRGRDMTDTVIFSPQFGNLSKSEFTFDYSNYFNYIYTAGEGEGKDRVVIGYESDDVDYRTLCGLNRREYWLDERNCSSNSDHPQSDTYYFVVLQNKGREKCKELRPVVQYSGEIVDNGIASVNTATTAQSDGTFQNFITIFKDETGKTLLGFIHVVQPNNDTSSVDYRDWVYYATSNHDVFEMQRGCTQTIGNDGNQTVMYNASSYAKQVTAEHLFKKIMSESGRFGKIKLDNREFISGSHFCLECKT